ncbi:MAG: hypothetical protein IJ563_05415, partial [Selenomonadaceae bacterium]|nr:hypothetical protein [Selenomonadaceae bacterium]
VLDDITGDGYTVDNDVIRGLLTGKVKVVEQDGKLTLVFTDGSTVQEGTNTIDGYTFTKNTDGTYTYTVIDGNNTTNYNIRLNPGDITKYTTQDIDVVINVDSRTETDGVLNTITGDGYTVNNSVIRDLISGKVTVVEKDGKMVLTLSDGTTLQEGTNTVDGYTFTKNTDGTFTYTVIDGNNTTNYNIKINPGDIKIINSPTPEPTPDPTPEPTPNPTPTPDSTPDVTPDPTPEPIPNPSPEPTPEPTAEQPTEVPDEPDTNLRSSNIESFPEDKGDYVDLDLQDHNLIETTNVNEEVNNLNVTPEEFNDAASRNIVNNDSIPLTSINETSETPTNENFSGGNELTGINSENPNQQETTSDNPESQETTPEDSNQQETTSDNENNQNNTETEQNSQQSDSENENDNENENGNEEESTDSEEK